MQFHVLGLGSVGTLLAHHLRCAIPIEHSIILIHKRRSAAEQAIASGNTLRVERGGVVSSSTGYKVDAFNTPFPDHRPPPYPSQLKTEGICGTQFNTPIDSLLVTTKAHQAVYAIAQLAPRISANSTIVLLQNGMGLYEQLADQVFRNAEQRPHFILGSNTNGSFRKGDHHVVHSGAGNVEFGIVPDSRGRNFEASLYDESLPSFERQLQLNDITHPEDPDFKKYKSLRDTIAALLLLEPLHTTWRPMHEMQIILRRKLVVNAVINPLTAIMGCRNGDLFLSDAARTLMTSVCHEASRAFLEEFQSEATDWIGGLADQGVDVNDVNVSRFPHALTKESLEEEVLRIAQATKGNISSMLSDIRHAIPTEIDYINGYLCRIGKAHNVKMTTNSVLMSLVKLRTAIPLDQQL